MIVDVSFKFQKSWIDSNPSQDYKNTSEAKVRHLLSENPKSKMPYNLKLFECWYDPTSGRFHTWLHVTGSVQSAGALKNHTKLSSGYVYKMHMKQINFVFRLGSHP